MNSPAQAPGWADRYVDWMLRHHAAGAVFLLQAATLLGSLVILIDAGLRTPAAPQSMMSMARAGSEERAHSIIDSWLTAEPVSLSQSALRYLAFDLLFLVFFFALTAFGCFYLTRRLASQLQGGRARLATLLGVGTGWLQLPAAVLDVSEDLAILQQLRSGASGTLAQLAWWSHWGKLGLAVLAIGVLLSWSFLLAWRVQKRFPLLQYLWHCRFPLLTGTLLFLLGPLAVLGLPMLLRNLFALSSWGLLVVYAVALAGAVTVLVALRNILEYGDERFDLLPAPAWIRQWLAAHGISVVFWLSLPVLSTALAVSQGPWFLVAVLLALAILLTLRHRSAAQVQPGHTTGPGSHGERPAPGGAGGCLAGYLSRDGKFLRGHVAAAAFLALSVVIYLAVALPLKPDAADWSYRVPALAYLLMLITIGAWILPGASFFLDRFRFPTTVVLALFVLISIWDADHYYEVYPRDEAIRVPSPEEAFDARGRLAGNDSSPVVVVAASGGGISAAVWTAHALTQMQQHSELGADWVKAIRLVSTASGGTVGAMYYLDAFTPEGFPPSGDAAEIVARASAPSLDALAWGMVYMDIWRGLLPGIFHLGWLDQTRDRGWTLESAWKHQLPEPEKRLSQWASAVHEGWLPPAVFNATVVETGQQYLFTPLRVPPEWQAESLLEKEPPQDIPIATAARLSSTFPWVSPIARARLEGAGLSVRHPEGGRHLADGGYYDNFGVISSINWIETVAPARLEQLRARGLILVVINAATIEGAESAPAVKLEEGQDKGWIYATVGPLVTLANVLFSTQLRRNTLEIELIKKRWRQEGVPMASFWFELDAPTPLSWQLTRAEIRAIQQIWTNPSNSAKLEQLVQCFKQVEGCQ